MKKLLAAFVTAALILVPLALNITAKVPKKHSFIP